MKIRININHLIRAAINAAILICGLGLGILLWGRFELPFSNPHDVMGPLVLKKYNPANGILNYLLLITMPTLLFLAVHWIEFFWNNKGIKKDHKNKIKKKSNARMVEFAIPFSSQIKKLSEFCFKKIRWIYLLHWFVVIFFSVSGIFYWLSMDFYYFPMDIFHEGESLTPAWKYLQTGELWKGSFFIHGVLYDPFLSILGWKIFDQVSIGAYRIFTLFMSHIVILPLALLFYTTAKSINRSSSILKTMLLVQAFIFIYYTTEPLKGLVPLQYLEKRDLFVLIGLSFLISGIGYKKNFLFFLAGCFSALCYVYTIDRGAYFTAILLVVSGGLIVFPLVDNKKKNLFFLFYMILGIITGWMIFLMSFGMEESSHFFRDTLAIYQVKDLFDSFKFSDSFFYKIPMIAIAIQLLLFVVYFFLFYLPGKINRTRFYIHLIFTVMSVVYFRSAFGRGDVTHLLYASSFAWFGLVLIFWNYCIRLNYRSITIILIALLALNLHATQKRYKSYKPSMIKSFASRASIYAAYPDKKFLDPKLYKSIQGLKELFQDQPGIMVYSSDAGLPYLLRKVHYGKNYIVWFSSSAQRRQELKKDFEKYKPELLVVTGFSHCYDGICNDKRFPKLDKWIHKNYKVYRGYAPWEVYKRITP